VVKRTLGDREIAENVVVYDRVKDGAMVKVSYDSLTTPTLSKDKISFVGYDYAGRVKYLVLNDATGDAYEYGYFIFEEGEEGADYKYADTLGVRQADTSGSETVPHRGAYIGSIRSGGLGGVAFAANGSVAATVTLQTLKDVSRTAFDMDEMTVTVAGVTYPVSDKVQCYNKTTGKWLTPGKEGLTAARAYADTLTLYYDRTPDQGGKIRMVVVS
jgi:hypothetical protein